MSNAVVLNEKLEKSSEVALPAEYKEINSHNLYLYVKSYLASLRANTATAKTRAEVRGGGKKPWSQKGRGTARSGSTRSPIWVGGGKAFGPTKRNYDQKVNKKQKRLAFNYALEELAQAGNLYVVDSVKVESGKTKDAVALVSKIDAKDVLFIADAIDDKTFLAFRNLKKAEVLEQSEVNAYWLAAFQAVVVEKAVFDKMIKED
jgi:large subunit ribosomal protein L4